MFQHAATTLCLICLTAGLAACTGAPALDTGPPFEPLFPPGDTSAWRLSSSKAKGWVFTETGFGREQDGAGTLITTKPYKDFELVFEWKVSVGGNSGVIYRAQRGRGLEYQVLDDERHRAAKGGPINQSGALYNLKAPIDNKPYKPAGQWNTGRIIAVGDRMEHWLNGVKVVELDLTGGDWEASYRKSKYAELNHPNFGRVAGPIMFQDHGDNAWYRNVRVRQLSDEPSVESK
ncbi:MAG: DUF1080 domain-containing protein [Planctomycetota bacterium]